VHGRGPAVSQAGSLAGAFLRPLATEEARARFWELHVRLGVILTEVMCLVVVLYVIGADRPHRSTFVAMGALVGVATPGLLLLPVRRISLHPRGALLFYVWSVATTGIIMAVALLDGGAESPLVWLVVLTLTFAGLAYPPLGMLVMGGLMVIAYVTVVTLNDDLSARSAAVAAILAAFTVMSAWVSRNQWSTYDAQLALAARLATLADYDSLTQCLNRRAFGERLEATLSEATPDLPISVCLIDLDGFKQVNDVQGHVAGDRVLARVGASLLDSVRPTDSVCRLGGDEFAVLMPGVGPQMAQAVTERLVRSLREVSWASGVTASAGTATTVAPMPMDDLLHVADQAMYRAKSAGGDRCDVVA
jgi:diguanylate cyclase (GGDEF)-like protein